MRVLYVITAGNRGIGGHLYSLRDLATALSPHVDTGIVAIGRGPSPVFAGLSCPVHYVHPEDLWRLRPLWALFRLMRQWRPEVVHAFDTVAYGFARIAASLSGVGLLLTQCGGPNPKGIYPRSYFPKAEHLVLFSRENAEFIASRSRFHQTRFHVIPNRVFDVAPNQAAIASIRRRLQSNCCVVLRIGRISEFHLAAALQTIRLVRELNADGVLSKAVFVGTVQDETVKSSLMAAGEGCALVVTDESIVTYAASVLDVGDLVVGTGSNLMEAAARRRVLLAPLACNPLPALVTEENWRQLAQTNFSARGRLDPFDADSNYRSILSAARDFSEREKLGQFARALFEREFSIEGAVPRYLELYRECRVPPKLDLVDSMLNIVWACWRLYRSKTSKATSHE